MNLKIFDYFITNLKKSFILPKYSSVEIDGSTVYQNLPWTPARRSKFEKLIFSEFGVEPSWNGRVVDVVERIDQEHTKNFFKKDGSWFPRTDDFEFSGWGVVDRINALDPSAVLDVGCGYNLFKDRVANLTGIDKYNSSADFMVDIMEYDVPERSYDVAIVFGSVNFGSAEDIRAQMRKVVSLVKPGGMLFIRANAGSPHPNGKYINLYYWTFKDAYDVAEDNSCELLTLKKDSHSRIYIEMRRKP